MAKTKDAAPVAQPIETAPVAPTADAIAQEAEIALTLDEFCARLSLRDRRVELIGAFHNTEKREGHLKDVTSAFEARFEQFVNKPI